MYLMLLIIGVICGLAAVSVILTRRVWNYDSNLPDFEDVLLYESAGEGS